MKSKLTSYFFLLLAFIFLNAKQTVFAQEIKNHLYYIIDDDYKFSLTDIQKLQTEKLNEASFNLNLGYAAKNVWIIIDPEPSQSERIFLIENAHLDHIDLYLYSGNHLINEFKSGDNRDFYTRFFNNNFFNFNIPSNADKISLRVHSEGPLAIPIQILSYKDYFNYWNDYSIFHWIYFGFIGLFLLSNLLLFLWLKESIYIYYVLWLVSLGIITGVDFGYTFEYLWPHHPGINKYNSLFYFLSVFSLVFAEKILNLKNDVRWLYIVYRAFYLFFILSFLASFFIPYRISIELIYMLYIFAPVFSLFTAFYVYIKFKHESSQFFLIGLVALFASSIIYILAVGGNIEYNSLTENMLQIGSLIQIVFFNLATLSKISNLKKEKENILAEQNRLLEEKVTQRTIELSAKNEKIIYQNKQIEDSNKLLKNQQEDLEKLVNKRTEELQETNNELIDKNQRLEQFAYVTAHNLRGPVATLLGLSQIYNRKELSDPHNLIVLTKSEEITQKLDNIIKDLTLLLDLEKNISSMIEPVDLHEVLTEVKVLLQKEIDESGVEIKEDFSNIKNIRGVNTYFKNIFYNLLSNSIKFRRYNTKPIIEIYSEGNHHDSSIVFKDNSSGIDMEKYGTSLGSPYKRFHPDIEGKGLGLYITKKQVEAMRGELIIKSNPSWGTTIRIVFLNNVESKRTSLAI